jgi:hypothetical protein
MRDVLGKTKALSVQQSEAIGQEFKKYQGMIDKLVWKHISSHGGDYDALFSRAIDTLIVAYLKHDPSRSSWAKYIYVQIRLGFINLRLESTRRKHQTKTGINDVFKLMSRNIESNGDEFLEDLRKFLTADALAFLEYFLQETTSKNRREMFGKFRESMLAKGWSRLRVNTAIKELRDILLYMIREGE